MECDFLIDLFLLSGLRLSKLPELLKCEKSSDIGSDLADVKGAVLLPPSKNKNSSSYFSRSRFSFMSTKRKKKKKKEKKRKKKRVVSENKKN